MKLYFSSNWLFPAALTVPAFIKVLPLKLFCISNLSKFCSDEVLQFREDIPLVRLPSNANKVTGNGAVTTTDAEESVWQFEPDKEVAFTLIV